MRSYLVGGAVRDRLLGLPVRECDWVVVGASEQEMLVAGFRKVDADFPVFLHPETGDEYALARTERKIGAGYKGFSIEAGPEVTLEQDLLRRDLTINALAEDEGGRIIDVCHGLEDLKARVLRHITPAFEEDPVRILRVARFAARFGGLGFAIAPETLRLMVRMAASPDLKALKPERVWQEMQKALNEPQPWLFFELLYECGALSLLLPTLYQALQADAGTAPDPLTALAAAASQSADPRVRFVAVMYAGLEKVAVAEVCKRLRVEREYTELLVRVVESGPAFARLADADARAVLDLLERTQAFQQPERFQSFLDACSALWPEDAVRNCRRLQRALVVARGVDGKSLAESGLSGPALGHELRNRRVEAIKQCEAEKSG